MSKRTQIHHFIPCNCPEGGMILHGIDFEFEEPIIPPLVYVYHVHSPGVFSMPTVWERIKNAWSFLFGKSIYLSDVILDGEGVIKLRDACQDALNRWPEEFTAHFEADSLDAIYQLMEDEEVGRRLRKGATMKCCGNCGYYAYIIDADETASWECGGPNEQPNYNMTKPRGD
jgi:hypothetical protein